MEVVPIAQIGLADLRSFREHHARAQVLFSVQAGAVERIPFTEAVQVLVAEYEFLAYVREKYGLPVLWHVDLQTGDIYDADITSEGGEVC